MPAFDKMDGVADRLLAQRRGVVAWMRIWSKVLLSQCFQNAIRGRWMEFGRAFFRDAGEALFEKAEWLVANRWRHACLFPS